MVRRISDEGLAHLKRWEGLRLEAYQDVAGVWTIGYGSTRGVKPGEVISTAEAERRLRQDLEGAEWAVQTAVSQPLTDNQFAALVSFVYNVGVGAFRSSTLLKKLGKGDFAAVPAELMKWNKARVDGKLTVVPGLTNRRAAEAGLWAKGDFVSSREVAAQAPTAVPQAAQAVGAAGLGVVLVPLIEALAGVSWPVAAVIVVGLLVAGGGYLAWRRFVG